MTNSDRRARTVPVEALSALVCPCCGGPLSATAHSLECESRHTFDLARHGYVNLLSGGARPGTADTADMVSARERFLASDAFEPLAIAIVSAAEDHLDPSTQGVVVDVGAGTGWLLSRMVTALPNRSGIALDVSKYAARRAASVHARVFSVVCDAWAALPLRTGSASLILSFFAPRNPEEFARILAPAGVLIVVTPGPAHLAEITAPLGLIAVDPLKSERLEASFAQHLSIQEVRPVKAVMRLTREQVRDVAGMGPSAHHTVAEDVSRAAADLCDISEVTSSIDIRVMRHNL